VVANIVKSEAIKLVDSDIWKFYFPTQKNKYGLVCSR
jgi:hypothetical protein